MRVLELLIVLCFTTLLPAQSQECVEKITVSDTPVDITRSLASKEGSPKTCIIQFTTDSGFRLKLNITDVTKLPSTDSQCTFNYVKFADDEAGLANAKAYCDKDKVPGFDSKGNQMVLQYQMTYIDKEVSFSGNVKRVDAQASCGTSPESFDGSEQVFQFPLDQKPMELDVECTYKIVNNKGGKISAKIEHMKLAGTTPCSSDYVALSSTANPSSTSEYVKCGSTVPTDNFTTTGSELYWKVKVTEYANQPYLSMIIKSKAGFRNSNVLITFAAMNILCTFLCQ
ncbi:unnamed protein product [Echinostoma caproni]|uniref:CUB domain-containing protein n=1 Tax=Echinostoma caproni TaxID=27848 RepID=A0A183AYQ9_9TREM|nr:unnamed protein product [Echinostoma caproni]